MEVYQEIIYLWVTTWRDSVWVYLYLHIVQVENSAAVRRQYDINASSQLIAFVLCPYGFRGKIHYTNDGLSC